MSVAEILVQLMFIGVLFVALAITILVYCLCSFNHCILFSSHKNGKTMVYQDHNFFCFVDIQDMYLY